jgi:hypothetical protein
LGEKPAYQNISGRVVGNLAGLVRDVAALLGTLLHQPVRRLHGRWLPVYALRAINQRVRQPEALDDVRSELQSQRTRWLHYVAQMAGLAGLHDGVLLPTVEAWDWLALPYQAAHHDLTAAIRADLQSRQPLWAQFRLPEVGLEVWDYLLSLPPGSYTLSSLRLVLRLHTLDPDIETQIRAALAGTLAWADMQRIRSDWRL